MARFCSNCGSRVTESANYCGACGFALSVQQNAQNHFQQSMTHAGITCRRCGSNNITVQTIQEDLGFTTSDASKTKYRPHYIQKRAIVKKNKNISITSNRIAYRTIFTCLTCGNSWTNYVNSENPYGYSIPR